MRNVPPNNLQIYEYWKKLESQMMSMLNDLRFEQQLAIRQKHRTILYDWLVEVKSTYNGHQRSLELSTYLLDMYLTKECNHPLKFFQGLGIAAYMIATSLLEVTGPDLGDLCYICDNSYSRDVLRGHVSNIAATLDFQLWWPTPISFFRYFWYQLATRPEDSGHRLKQCVYAYYWLELLHHYPLMRRMYRPSLVAAGVCFLARLQNLSLDRDAPMNTSPDSPDSTDSHASPGYFKAQLISSLSKISGYSSKELSQVTSDVYLTLQEALKSDKHQSSHALRKQTLGSARTMLPSFDPTSEVPIERLFEPPSNTNNNTPDTQGTVEERSLVKRWGKASGYDSVGEIATGVYGSIRLLNRSDSPRPEQLTKCLSQASSRPTSPYRAGKKFSLFGSDGTLLADHVLFEIMALKNFRHPNLLYLEKIIWEPNDETIPVMLVMPYCQQNIHQYFKSLKEPAPHPVMGWITREITQGLDYLHGHGFCHRDLKSENILYDTDLTTESLKICDFGMGCFLSMPPSKNNTSIQTLWFRAPEVLLGEKRYGLGIDVWSLGVIIAQLAIYHKRPAPLTGESELDQIRKILKFSGKKDRWPEATKLPDWNCEYFESCLLKESQLAASKNYHPEIKEFLLWVLQCNPALRPTCQEILHHSFLKTESIQPLSSWHPNKTKNKNKKQKPN